MSMKNKEGRGMNENMKKIDCEMCGDQHIIDKYNWVHSCVGYYQLDDYEHDIVIHKLKDGIK